MQIQILEYKSVRWSCLQSKSSFLLQQSTVVKMTRNRLIPLFSLGGNASSPLTYGLMFEDINHSGDGGIYAELIRNRAFQGSTEFPSILDPWIGTGGAVLTLQNTSLPLSSALPTSVNVASGSTSSRPGTTIWSSQSWMVGHGCQAPEVHWQLRGLGFI